MEPLDSLLSPSALDGLTTRPIAELREQRVQCTAVEGDVSMARRVAQGRLDIVGHEVRRRAGDETASGEVNALLFDMPDILADAPRTSAPSGRPADISAPGEVALALVSRLDRIATPADLSGISDLGESRVHEMFEHIRGFELELSSVRRQLHERIDAIQSEIGRRYRDGEASIDSFLS